MISTSLLLYLTAVLLPTDSVTLDRTFSSLKCYNNELFVARRVGQSIFNVVASGKMTAMNITDEANYLIYDFQITPFAIYINRGVALEKYYISYGRKETIYTSDDIAAFAITPSGEITLADRQTHEMVFLDFAYQKKFTIDNVHVIDLDQSEDKIYALTRKHINIYDEYGNLIERKQIPEPMDKIYVDKQRIYLFSKSLNYIHRMDADWTKTDLPFGVSDMCTDDKVLVILDGTGTTLYFYNRNDF